MLALLSPTGSQEATAWLRTALTTFGRSVASFLPGHFAAYARVYHPVAPNGASELPVPTWRTLAAKANVDLADPAAAMHLLEHLPSHLLVDEGSLALGATERLLGALASATATPAECYFAVWEGFGDLAVSRRAMATLALPHRAYFVFRGPLEAARTSFSAIPYRHQSANLWWPADHAWCVATEIDLPWTYVGGARATIEALLAGGDLDAVATEAGAYR